MNSYYSLGLKINRYIIKKKKIIMDKLRKALSGQDNRDNDSSTGILPVSKILHNIWHLIITFLFY